MNQRKGRTTFIVSFLAPAVVIYAVFVIWPLLQAFRFSLFRWRGVSQQKAFIGLENFRNLWADSVFWQALRNNLWLLVVVGSLAIVLAIAIAHGMQSEGRFSRALRGIYLIPQVISLVVVAVLWMFLYNPSYGLVTQFLKLIGLGNSAKTWLGDPHTALPAVGAAFLWYIAGFYIMLFAAGLRSIPSEINEAAELDGALGLRRFWRVTWPMLWSIKRVAVVYVVINVMNVFTLVYLMTQGGPDRKTEVMLTYLYEQSFQNSEFGYATALAIGNFLIALILSGLVFLLFRRNPERAKA